jgi:hypothetical protein
VGAERLLGTYDLRSGGGVAIGNTVVAEGGVKHLSIMERAQAEGAVKIEGTRSSDL